jgi:hypothetical protein
MDMSVASKLAFEGETMIIELDALRPFRVHDSNKHDFAIWSLEPQTTQKTKLNDNPRFLSLFVSFIIFSFF